MQIQFVLTLLICATSFSGTTQDKTPPNVVIIFTDDHRYSGVHALGGQAVRTPNLDQLAYEGIVFTETYLMGSFLGATCIPSRAMLHTGRNLFELDGDGRNIPETHTMMSEAFKAAGYHARHEGKWHQDFGSLGRAFTTGGLVMGKPAYLTDHFRMPFSEWNAEGKFPKENAFLLTKKENGEVGRRPLNPDDKRGPTGTEKDGPHSSEVIADGAVNFIMDYGEKQPMFMYVAFHAPHDPRQAPARFKQMYPEADVQLPPSYLPQHPFDNGHAYIRDERLAKWPRTDAIARKQLSDYYAIITHLDEQIGRVVKALKSSGRYENTLIVFAGDSGLAVGNHGLMGKQNLYDEDGLHVPFVLSGGVIAAEDRGRRIDALAYIHDIFPTVCELTDIDRPTSVTGRSLVPVISGTKDRGRVDAYYAYRQHQRAYRKGDFKLIEYVRAPDNDWERGPLVAGSRVTQLFNVTEDPWETLNLAPFPEYEQTIQEMRKEMRARAEEIGDDADARLGQDYDFWDFY